MSERPLEPSDDERRVAEKLAVRFEREDVGPMLVARAAAGLIVMTVVVAAIAVWLLVFLRRHESAGDPQRPALFYTTGERQPEGVRLQSNPVPDLQASRAKELKILNSYGWVDQGTGVVHIPIDHAMRLYVARRAGSAPAVRTDAVAGRVPTDAAPVPSALIGVSPAPPPSPSPAASDTPVPPPAHAPGPAGGHP